MLEPLRAFLDVDMSFVSIYGSIISITKLRRLPLTADAELEEDLTVPFPEITKTSIKLHELDRHDILVVLNSTYHFMSPVTELDSLWRFPRDH